MRIDHVGFLLALAGFTLFLSAAVPVAHIGQVVNTSFNLEPGDRTAPYQEGTYYHTKIFCDSTLLGTVSVQNGSIDLTARGFNVDGLMGLGQLARHIPNQHTFIIDPADDQYTFTFGNVGPGKVRVDFSLVELWITAASPFLWLLALAGQILLLPVSLGLLMKRRNLVRFLVPAMVFTGFCLLHQIILIYRDQYTVWRIGSILLTIPVFSTCVVLFGSRIRQDHKGTLTNQP